MPRSLIFCGFVIKTVSQDKLDSQRLLGDSHTNLEEKQWSFLPYKVLCIQIVTK